MANVIITETDTDVTDDEVRTLRVNGQAYVLDASAMKRVPAYKKTVPGRFVLEETTVAVEGGK